MSLTSLGRLIGDELKELTEQAIIDLLAEASRPAKTEEIEAYLREIDDELIDEAIGRVKGQQS